MYYVSLQPTYNSFSTVRTPEVKARRAAQAREARARKKLHYEENKEYIVTYLKVPWYTTNLYLS